MIPDEVRTEIMTRLARTEREEGVRILLAIESGSRAWGFASPNSDYDVRFIYARPADWYLAVDLEERRDVIEYPIVDDIDLNGWDLRKALRLLWKTNPAMVEWIQSPITYIESGGFGAGARELLPALYSSERGIYHYRSMAKTNYGDHLRAALVPLKKYFYVLRALLSVHWIERYGTAAPIEFHKLLHLLDHRPDLLARIDALLAQKRAAPELGLSEPIALLNEFIEHELARLESVQPLPAPRAQPLPALNALFHAVLREHQE
ncbi:nucleotidyltransferase domain-containing protein [Massilia genomosp. 1]|uniref:Nucleotidyltransferase domain-containing protein n=1 Tax=Massilia genomosp. 1 TaxID=2609280 RepID=A0ABX0MXJ4_9BURK|nr:nucleotidyltransferase domain-containing protein [Massilia genomosp. 1]NHZ64788.1 nucleotidyltransferase domain-containing protein [Massilia genomosp. 1]